MKQPMVALVLACLFAIDVAFASDNPDERILKPYAGTEIRLNEMKDFDELELPLAASKGGKIAKLQKVTGRWTRLEYTYPQGRSGLEVFKNYSDALTQGGFKILFSCRQPACGPEAGNFKGLGYSWPYDTSHYILAQLDRNGERIWAQVDIRTGLVIFVNVIREKAMETGKVTVNAEALKMGIADEGHVAVYGIEFDTNRSELKAASAPIIAEIAKLMIANPNLRIYVVGHTDNVGTLASNLDLSVRRAKSVVKELVTRHKIAGNRLSGQGVGPLVPVATNGTDKGRARNRRVDLVQQ